MNGSVLGKAPPKISRSHQSKTLSKAPRAAACSWSSLTSPPKWLGDCFIPEGQLEETWTRPAAAFDSRFVAENTITTTHICAKPSSAPAVAKPQQVCTLCPRGHGHCCLPGWVSSPLLLPFPLPARDSSITTQDLAYFASEGSFWQPWASRAWSNCRGGSEAGWGAVVPLGSCKI